MRGVEPGSVVQLTDGRRGLVLDRAPDREWWVMPDDDRELVRCPARLMRPVAVYAVPRKAVV